MRLCYREFLAELTPALASDPRSKSNENTEAGEWIESYRIDVHAGEIDPTGIVWTEADLDLIRESDLTGVLAALAQGGTCVRPSEDPSIVLATLTLWTTAD